MTVEAPRFVAISPAGRGRSPVRGRLGNAGFTAMELLVVMAIVGILTALTIPIALTYLNTSTALQGARDLRSRLNQARMLAVTTRQPICVTFTSAGYFYHQNTCAGTIWTNSQTGPAGLIGFAEPVTVSGTSPLFSQFGNATQSTVLTVTAAGGRTMTVTVALSGRISIP